MFFGRDLPPEGGAGSAPVFRLIYGITVKRI
jgi:hypothetical protein